MTTLIQSTNKTTAHIGTTTNTVEVYVEKKIQSLLGEFEDRWVTRRQVGEWGTDARDGVRNGVSERLPSKEDFMSMFNRNFA
jgi:hypothetical protein